LTKEKPKILQAYIDKSNYYVPRCEPASIQKVYLYKFDI